MAHTEARGSRIATSLSILSNRSRTIANMAAVRGSRSERLYAQLATVKRVT